jgi:hypothetical protein
MLWFIKFQEISAISKIKRLISLINVIERRSPKPDVVGSTSLKHEVPLPVILNLTPYLIRREGL